MLCYEGFKQERLLLNFVSEHSLRMKKYPIFCFLVGANIWVWCVIQVGKVNEVSPCSGFSSKLRSPPNPDTFFFSKGLPKTFRKWWPLPQTGHWRIPGLCTTEFQNAARPRCFSSSCASQGSTTSISPTLSRSTYQMH